MFLFKNEVMLNSLMWMFRNLNINCNLGHAKNKTMPLKVLFLKKKKKPCTHFSVYYLRHKSVELFSQHYEALNF